MKMRKSVCFIHSTNMAIWRDEMLLSLLQHLHDCGAMKVFEIIFVCNIGDPLDEGKITKLYPSVIIQNNSSNLSLYENVTIRALHAFSLIHAEYDILYLHTKGVSHAKDSGYMKGILSWNQYALTCVATHHEQCTDRLQIYDVLGSNYRNDGVNPPHFSGNFWWARSEYIRTLTVDHLKEKYDAEFWLFRGNPSYYNIFNLEKMYEHEYPLPSYASFVTKQFENAPLKVHESSELVSVLFGLYGLATVDITNEVRPFFSPAGLIFPVPLNDMRGDPVPNKRKLVYVHYRWNGIDRHECLDEKSQGIKIGL